MTKEGQGYLHEKCLRAFCLNDPILDLLPKVQGLMRDDQLPSFDARVHFGTFMAEQYKAKRETVKAALQAKFPHSFFDAEERDEHAIADAMSPRQNKDIIWNPRLHYHTYRMILNPDYLIRKGDEEYEPVLIHGFDSQYGRVRMHLYRAYLNRNKVIPFVFTSPSNEERCLFDALVWTKKVNSLPEQNAFANIEELMKNYGAECSPNMKNSNDFPWHHAKKSIAQIWHAPTMLWYCGYERVIKWQKKHCPGVIPSWRHRDFNATGLDFKKSIGRTLDAILSINKDESKPPIMQLNHIEALPTRNHLHLFFVDFEVLMTTVEEQWKPCIFNIGVHGSSFRSFFSEHGADDEKTLVLDFIAHVEQECDMGKSVMLVHWTNAERKFLQSAVTRHADDSAFSAKVQHALKSWKWFDLERYMHSNLIVVRGAFNFKLKHIARAMHSHGLISSTWDDDSPCSDGLAAMTAYIRYLQGRMARDDPLLAHIIVYNEIDCRVMHEIYGFLERWKSDQL